MTDDLIERAEAMLTTFAYAQSKGITQAYPDSSVTMVVSDLVAALKDRDEALETVRAALKAARAENEAAYQTIQRQAALFSELRRGKRTVAPRGDELL